MTKRNLILKKIGVYIRYGRKEKQMSQVAVSRKIGLSQGALSKLENGLLEPGVIVWFKLRQVLGEYWAQGGNDLLKEFYEKKRKDEKEEHRN